MNVNSGIRLTVVIRIIIGLLLISASALASTPAAPKDLKGSLYSGGGARVISFAWQSGDAKTRYSGFNLYQSTNGGSFTVVATAADSNGWGYCTISSLQGGSYQFYVTAVSGNQESAPSNTVSFKFSSATIQFGGLTPRDTGDEGVAYTYSASAIASDGSAVVYSVIGPGSINASTGAFTWTPQNFGTQTLSILASLASDPTVTDRRSWSVYVRSNPASGCSMVTGTVTDTNGNPIASGSVTAFLVSPNPDTSGNNNVAYNAAHIQNGTYSMQLRPGTYVFYANGPINMMGSWYHNGTDRSNALPVSFKCDTNRVNFVLAPAPNLDTITGSVVSAADGSPVASQIVTTSGGVVAHIPVNADGTYMLWLADNRSYQIQAVPADTDRFESQYYNMAATSSAATLFHPTGNTSGINFVLNAKPYYDNAVSGVILDKASHTIQGLVDVYRLDAAKGVMTPVLVKQIYSPDGYFSFHNVLPGSYVLYMIPSDSVAGIAPGYYKDGDFAVRNWSNATIIKLGASTNLGNVVIKLPNVNGQHGKNRLHGGIVSGGRTIKGDDGGSQGMQPLAGATVFAFDADGNLSGFGFTDAQGNYAIEGLPSGLITVNADRIGFAPFQTTVTLTDGQDGTTDVTMHTAAPAAVPTATDAVLGSASIFPNPATGSVTATFVAKNGTATVSVTSTSGATLLQRQVSTVDGMNVLPIDLSGLTSGLYLVSIKSGTSSIVLPVTLTH